MTTTDAEAIVSEPTASAAPTGVPRARARLSRGVIENELRQPLEAVTRSLQRLSLQDIGETSTAHAIRRSRTLVAEILAIVDELEASSAPVAGPVARAAQERISLHEVAQDAADDVYEHFDRTVNNEVAQDLAITTDPARVRTILTNMLATATRASSGAPVTLSAQWSDRAIEATVSWTPAAEAEPTGDGDPGLVLARTLARSLGGELELTAHDTNELAIVRLPQLRAGDGD